MFDLTVLSGFDIRIQSFDVNITSLAGENAIVFRLITGLAACSGYETDASAWTLAGTASVASKGLDVPTPRFRRRVYAFCRADLRPIYHG